jgi:hypothetical protein
MLVALRNLAILIIALTGLLHALWPNGVWP